MSKKKKNEEKGYWQPRPGRNWLLGYVEGKPVTKGQGIREVQFDRSVKDGKSLNK